MIGELLPDGQGKQLALAPTCKAEIRAMQAQTCSERKTKAHHTYQHHLQPAQHLRCNLEGAQAQAVCRALI